MELQYFCTIWGNTLPFEKFCKKAKQAGYGGVEMDLPLTLSKGEKSNILKTLEAYDLKLIAQYWQSIEKNFNENRESYKKHLYALAETNPVLINGQTGKDYFTFEQNMKLITVAENVSKETGVEILHETHRGKFLFNLPVLKQCIDSNKKVSITLDASHWCTVHESLLDDQSKALSLAIKHTRHIHARVGFEEGPQINDPRAPEWASLVEKYFSWWDLVVMNHKKKKKNLTITPEFGPIPYMPTAPYTKKNLSVQWDVNVHMMKLFKERYHKI